MMAMQGSLSVERMCRVAAVSRASFYRWLEPSMPVEEEMEVRAAIQAVVLEHRRRYGYRRVTRELRRRGLLVNHKRVARLMGEDNLLAVQPRAWVATTNPGHELEVYMNLAARMKVTGINQLWVADITYIRLAAEFVYLAVVLDAYSRKVVGWALERTLTTQLTVAAPSNGKRSTPGLIAIWTICAPTSRSSSSSITIAAGCTRRWVTGRRKSSSRWLRPQGTPWRAESARPA